MSSATSTAGFAANYAQVLRLVWEADRRVALIAVLLALGSAAALPVQIWVTKLIIDVVVNVVSEPPGSVADVDWRAVVTPVIGLGLVRAGAIVVEGRLDHFRWQLSEGVRHHIEYLVLERASHLDLAFFENHTFYDRMTTVLREAYRAHNLVWLTLEMLCACASLIALLAMLYSLHSLAVIVLVITAAPGALVGGHFAKRFFNLVNSHASLRRRTHYYQELLSSRDAVKELRIFGLGGLFLGRFHETWGRHLAEEKSLRTTREKVGVALAVLSLAGTVGIRVFAVIEAVLSRITVGDVALFLQVTEQAREQLGGLLYKGGQIYENNLFTRDLIQFLSLEPSDVSGALRGGEQHGPFHLAPRPIHQGIEFRGVSFRYPGGSRDVLKDVSFQLLPGENVALVGENGAGKTTLIKLLARLYDPTEGTVLLDDRDYREYEIEDLRRQIGVVFQDFVRYDLTVRENIAVGQVEHVSDDNKIREAAERGGALPIITGLPGGIDCMLGRSFEGGLDLSGGEWQKIALSRAFLRQSQVLILDEPTAALDAFAELELYSRFAELTHGALTLYVSHRFSTVRAADRILVLRDGAVIEEGSHEELIEQDGHYSKLFSAQAERYR